MSYVKKSSLDEEEICNTIPFHWLVWFVAILITLVLLAVLAALVWFQTPWFTWVIPLILVPLAWWHFLSIERAVTTRRVVRKTGVFNIETEEMQLPALETVEFEQSLMGRIFGYATITLTGRGVSDLKLEMCPGPYEVKKAVERAQKALRSKNGAM